VTWYDQDETRRHAKKRYAGRHDHPLEFRLRYGLDCAASLRRLDVAHVIFGWFVDVVAKKSHEQNDWAIIGFSMDSLN